LPGQIDPDQGVDSESRYERSRAQALREKEHPGYFSGYAVKILHAFLSGKAPARADMALHRDFASSFFLKPPV
jgi:hypothetical protein